MRIIGDSIHEYLKDIRTWMSVDPGIEGTGLAYWIRNSQFGISDTVTDRPLYHGHHIAWAGVIDYPHGLSGGGEWGWVSRASAVAESFEKELDICKPQAIWCEFQEFFADAKGYTATARGDIYKLCYLCGMFYQAARVRNIEMYFVRPTTWKGQLPKTAIEKRVRRILGDDTCAVLNAKTHAWDALGIGLFVKGDLYKCP